MFCRWRLRLAAEKATDLLFALFLKCLGNQVVTVFAKMLKIHFWFLFELAINMQHI